MASLAAAARSVAAALNASLRIDASNTGAVAASGATRHRQSSSGVDCRISRSDAGTTRGFERAGAARAGAASAGAASWAIIKRRRIIHFLRKSGISKSHLAAGIDFNKFSRQIAAGRRDRVQRRVEQYDLLLDIDGWNYDQKTCMDIDKPIKPQKITPIIRDKGKVASNNLWHQGAVAGRSQSQRVDMVRLESTCTGFGEQFRGQAFVNKKSDQRRPGALAHVRTAAIPPSGIDG